MARPTWKPTKISFNDLPLKIRVKIARYLADTGADITRFAATSQTCFNLMRPHIVSRIQADQHCPAREDQLWAAHMSLIFFDNKQIQYTGMRWRSFSRGRCSSDEFCVDCNGLRIRDVIREYSKDEHFSQLLGPVGR